MITTSATNKSSLKKNTDLRGNAREREAVYWEQAKEKIFKIGRICKSQHIKGKDDGRGMQPTPDTS